MWVLVLRSLLLYLLVMASLRLMGKRQVGQLQPAELVIAIVISDVATIPIQDTEVSILNGVIPILTLLIAELTISFISLKNRRLRIFFSGAPSVMIHKGVIDEREMARQRYNLDDLLEELRVQGYPDISKIEFAILETGGQISVEPKSSAAPVTCGDMAMDKRSSVLPYLLIADGHMDETELARAGKTRAWLEKQLKKRHIQSIKDVFIASLNAEEALFIQKKQRKHG